MRVFIPQFALGFFLLLAIPSMHAQYPFQAHTTSVGIDTTLGGMPDNLIFPLGTGLSLIDFNQDGLDDIVICNGEDLPMLWWLNNGDGTFAMIESPINNNRFQKVPLFGDIDNDGDPDLFVPGFEDRDRLYRNDGNLQFTDISSAAGILQNDEPTNGSSFCDVNSDGWLDLYVCNRSDEGIGNFLYINNGDGTFSEEAIQRGVGDGSQLTHQSVFFDYDNDGDQDLFLSNDRLARNSMYENDGSGYFTNVTAASGLGMVMDAMNSTAGDMDNDGYLDLYITNTPGGTGSIGVGYSRAFRNNGDGTFSEISNSVGLNLTHYAWSAPWIDFDNDRDLDIFVATYRPNTSFVIHQNHLEEYGLLIFLNPWTEGLPEGEQRSYSAAYFDYNNDGRLDMVTPNAPPSPVQLWENITTNENNWIRFTVEGTYSTRDGVGTRIELHKGENMYARALEMGHAYLAQSFNKIHFGLKDIDLVDSIVVKWLSGVTDTYYDLEPNQEIHLVEGESHSLEVAVNPGPVSCAGSDDGSLSVTPQGGTAPYTILWNTGETGFTISDLAPGRYLATVTDADGQTGLVFRDVSEPAALSMNMTSGNDTGIGDGWASVSASGGTGPFTYAWSSGHTSTEAGPLVAGLYDLSVSDAAGCEMEAQVAIYDESGPCAFGQVTSVEVGTTSARLYWGNVPHVRDVRIAYRETGITDWQYLVIDQAVSGVITGLTPFTNYEYRVMSRCQDLSKSTWSPIGIFQTLDGESTTCAAWMAYEVLVDNKQAMIYVQTENGADAYRIRFRVVGTMSWTRLSSAYSTFHTGQLLPGTEYEFQTATRCPDGWTSWSDSDYFVTEPDPQALPLQLPDRPDTEWSERRQLTPPVEARIFPNPVTDVLNVVVLHGTVSRLVVTDLSGKVCLDLDTPQMQIDVSQLARGTYIAQVWNGDQPLAGRRFVKF